MRVGEEVDDRVMLQGKHGNRNGDWLCPNTSCSNVNYAFRGVCDLVQVLDLLVHLVVVLELEVMGGDALPMTLVSLAGQLVVLLDFFVQMTGLVQFQVWQYQLGKERFATRINLVTMRVVQEIMLICSHRGGRGGGYKELDEEELEETKRRRKEAEEDDGVLYDEFGILKKKFRAKTQQAEARRVLPGAGRAGWEVDEFGVADKAGGERSRERGRICRESSKARDCDGRDRCCSRSRERD